MKEKTKMLTFGAMMLSIFAVFMLIDKFTGGSLIATLLLIFPMPFIVYSTKYGFKNSLLLFVTSIITAIVLGHPLSIFYAIAEALIGITCGSMLRNKKIKKFLVALVTIAMSIFVVVASVTFLAPILGVNIADSLKEIQDSAYQIYESVGFGNMMYDLIYNSNIVYIAFTLSTALLGIIQGVIIFVVGLILNKKFAPIIKSL
jgi:uncharacterized protein YybS (DUF2232 family)